METEVMLTTFDNPYDPFDEFIPWFLYDVEHGYYTCNLLARIAKSSDEFSTIEDKWETERAIDEIIDNDFLNIYKKVTRTVSDDQDDVASVVKHNDATVTEEVVEVEDDSTEVEDVEVTIAERDEVVSDDEENETH